MKKCKACKHSLSEEYFEDENFCVLCDTPEVLEKAKKRAFTLYWIVVFSILIIGMSLSYILVLLWLWVVTVVLVIAVIISIIDHADFWIKIAN